MIDRIMLRKNTFLFAILSSVLWGVIVQNVSSAVVASLKPLGFIVAAITDGITETQVLMPDGASEHGYSLRPSDIKRLQDAELVVWIGPEMEVFMQKFVERLASKKQIKISTLDGVKPLLMKRDYGGNDRYKDIQIERKSDIHCHHGEYNMHLWLSPQIAGFSAAAIHDRLVELMPQDRIKLDSNLESFKAQLVTTYKQIYTKLAPLKDKNYFVFHDAYGYYEKYYGLAPRGYFIVNSKIQPGAQHLHEIRTQLLKQKTTCIFTEPQFRLTVVEAMARGTSVRTGILDPLGMNIQLSKTSYSQFLNQLANQYANCLSGD